MLIIDLDFSEWVFQICCPHYAMAFEFMNCLGMSVDYLVEQYLSLVSVIRIPLNSSSKHHDINSELSHSQQKVMTTYVTA